MAAPFRRGEDAADDSAETDDRHGEGKRCAPCFPPEAGDGEWLAFQRVVALPRDPPALEHEHRGNNDAGDDRGDEKRSD
jgi:hypothetical protein